MPYWIEQTEGPHKTAIDNAVAEYKSGTSAESTWGRLAALYRKVEHSYAPSFEKHEERGEDSIDYMIRTWFPLYANLWFEGTREQCHAEAARLNRAGVGKFSVAYEY